MRSSLRIRSSQSRWPPHRREPPTSRLRQRDSFGVFWASFSVFGVSLNVPWVSVNVLISFSVSWVSCRVSMASRFTVALLRLNGIPWFSLV